MIDLFHNAPQTERSKNNDLLEERHIHLKTVCGLDNLIEGDILEFGVWKGDTINIIAEFFPDNLIYGFDSFEGLPEDWKISSNEKYNKHKKGYFAVDTLPSVKDNVRLIKGFFETSLPTWIQENQIKQIKLLHVDSDLYSSAATIFKNLNNYIVPGTVIIFDEFYPWGRKRYEKWEEHEYKAFCEWVKFFGREFEVLFHNNHQQCSVRIIK